MFDIDRKQMRNRFRVAWNKHRHRQPLEPLEQLIASVVRQHPEYHALLESTDEMLVRDFTAEAGETNPFLHMGMHISILEQVGSDRPSGIADLYRRLTEQSGDPHSSEHRMMECLGQALWEAQRSGRMPDEPAYLDCLRRLLRKQA